MSRSLHLKDIEHKGLLELELELAYRYIRILCVSQSHVNNYESEKLSDPNNGQCVLFPHSSCSCLGPA